MTERNYALLDELADALAQLTEASAWHIQTNGEAVVGRDGRQRQTINMILADHKIVDALPVARAALARYKAEAATPRDRDGGG